MERVLAAEQAAQRELAQIPEWLWDGKTPPVPVAAIADSHYGLLVEEREDLARVAGLGKNAHVSGLLLPDLKEVWVNADEARVRRRFTVGHELGHWVLHCDRGFSPRERVVHCREGEVREAAAGELNAPDDAYVGYPADELDANQFAAALLMPRTLVDTLRATEGEDSEQLAKLFVVSSQAVARRLWFLSHETPS